ncbi:DUF305 domain-containing protein [Micromonospora sp. LOL_023]|uniref:DUF305 domain-containing protein n=1 Tax=Micromonospora sp. LOL_023 TaxID=3345418 RepID=UPI003A86D1B6
MPMLQQRHSTRRRLAAAIGITVVVALVATVVHLSGSTTDDSATGPGATGPTTAGAGSDPPVILPGRPGEESEIRPGSQVAIDPPQYNSLDTWYVQMMIPHHTQAVQLATLAVTRTDSPGIRAFADRIRSGQSAEIDVLRNWLRERDLPAGDHDHQTMPGMQTEQAARALAATRGTEFDRRFVEMMSEHHQGAVDMSTRVLIGGSDLTIEELATAIAAEQAIEIDRMRDLIDM